MTRTRVRLQDRYLLFMTMSFASVFFMSVNRHLPSLASMQKIRVRFSKKLMASLNNLPTPRKSNPAKLKPFIFSRQYRF